MQHILIMFFTFLMTGCMVGANFHSPPPPPVHSYTQKPLPPQTAATPRAGKSGKSQTFVYGQNVRDDWWKLFRSKELDCLVERGLANSPTIKAAYENLRQAQEALNVQIGTSLFPAVNATAMAQRQKFSGSTIGTGTSSIFNLFNTSVNVAYTLDLFGGARRQIEALGAQVDYQQFQLIAAWLTLSGNIVTTAIAAASYQEQIKATTDLIKLMEDQLIIMEKQFKLGGISLETVLTQETLVYQTRATLPPLQKALSQSRHALAVLVGDFPNAAIPVLKLDAINLPHTIPVSLPSYLVRQRPDVRASEALLHAACANVGVATANLFPQFTINGTFGWETSIPSQLFRPGSNIWSISGNLLQPIFRGGALLASRRQAIAAYNTAAAQYRQTVLTAFQNVADSLRALETDARRLKDQTRANIAAKKNLEITLVQYRLGGAGYLSLLVAQQQYQQTLITVIQAKATRYNDTVALFQSLGGGWWNTQWCVKESLNAC